MPLEDLYSNGGNVSKRVKNFFDQSSFYVPNKFIVALFGEYVDKAITKMSTDIDKISDLSIRAMHRESFETWKATYFNKDGNYVDLNWACQGAVIPQANSETEDGDYVLDAVKGIRYPLIKTHAKIQTVSLRIIEDRKLMLYQFFNAIINQFHVPLALKPRSSFHKLSILIVALTQHEGSGFGTKQPKENSDNFKGLRDFVNKDIRSIPGQVFEFNSAVLTNVDALNLNNNNKAPLEYNVSFKVPNSFQNSFNTSISGLRDNTSDRTTLNAATDSNGLDGRFIRNPDGSVNLNKVKYKTNFLERDVKDLKNNIRDFEV
jgi:hypothetical protein